MERQTLLLKGPAPPDIGGSFDPPSEPLRPWSLIRRYFPLMAVFLLAGGAAGFAAVVWATPAYRSSLMIEVQGINQNLMKNSLEFARSFDSDSSYIQTQITLLRSGPFPGRVIERLQNEPLPAPVNQEGFWGQLHRKVRGDASQQSANSRTDLDAAIRSFDARVVNGTRLIELICSSNNPETAAQFLNTVADEFISDAARNRTQSSQRIGEWLRAQMDETQFKIRDGQKRLEDYVKSSNNIFAAPDSNLDDAKLKQLQAELATSQSERISRQSRYEMATRSTIEAIPEVLNNAGLATLRERVITLRQQLSALQLSYTDQYGKVRALKAQADTLDEEYRHQVQMVVEQLKGEFEAAQRRERLLQTAYNAQAQRVASLQGKEAAYNSLRHDLDVLQKNYETLQQQSNEAGITNSAPANPIRLVQPAGVPRRPFEPVPTLFITFGLMSGFVLTAGIAFIRERLDRSVKSSNMVRILLNAPALGAIPSASATTGFQHRKRNKLDSAAGLELLEREPERVTARQIWRDSHSPLAESFRSLLASVTRETSNYAGVKTILVTSPTPGDGKTTITANLGVALAEAGRRVVLLDADFRRPNQHAMFRMGSERGLTDILTEVTSVAGYSINEIAAPTGFANLSIVTNRPSVHNISQFLHSQRLRELLQRLRREFDTVLIDAPPILLLADARVIAPLTDGVILVLRAGSTDRDIATEAFERLAADGVPVIGSVLNDWTPEGRDRNRYNYNPVLIAGHSESLDSHDSKASA